LDCRGRLRLPRKDEPGGFIRVHFRAEKKDARNDESDFAPFGALARCPLEATAQLNLETSGRLLYSNELQRSHARPEPCNLPRSGLTQSVN